MKHLLLFVFLFFFGVQMLFSQLRVSDIFTSNMMLQRDKPIHFWGKGIPGVALEVQFAGKTRKTIIYKDSLWSIQFKRQNKNAKPQSIKIVSGKEKIVLSNVLVGDIWLCIGQSNMEWPMWKEENFKEELNNANLPSLRFYNPEYAGKNVYNESFKDSVLNMLTIEDFYKGKWAISNSVSIKKMSAVGYYFGKEILEKEQVPIGLINMAIGGAPIESFISCDAMTQNIQFSEKLSGNWLLNENLPVWTRERGNQNITQRPPQARLNGTGRGTRYVSENIFSLQDKTVLTSGRSRGTHLNNGQVKPTSGNKVQVIHKDDFGPNHAFKPGFAYSAGIQSLLKMPIKGILWYQGESNAQEIERVMEYGELQKLMIEDYRKQWMQPKMPFYWVQLSSIDTVNYNSKLWPIFRDEQRKLLKDIKHGGMAVSSDIGSRNSVHPLNKKDVGHRLARLALHKTYGKKIVSSGPLPRAVTFINGKVIISFNNTANGLITKDKSLISGFSFDGKHSVSAIIVGNSIEILTSKRPEYV